MFTGLELLACQPLAVPAGIMQHVVQVESSANPYAIGVVGGRLARQPRNLTEAVATAHMLEAGHYNYSLGLAQVNRANLRPYGLDTYRQAFSPCRNVAVGARILADCYTRMGGHWGKAFSCYYSGNPASGYRVGYVVKIQDAIHQGSSHHGTTRVTRSPPGRTIAKSDAPSFLGSADHAPEASARRVAMRSDAFDPRLTTASASGTQAAKAASHTIPKLSGAAPIDRDTLDVRATTVGQPSVHGAFVPTVFGPGDRPSEKPPRDRTAVNPGDHADLRQEQDDAAFVF